MLAREVSSQRSIPDAPIQSSGHIRQAGIEAASSAARVVLPLPGRLVTTTRRLGDRVTLASMDACFHGAHRRRPPSSSGGSALAPARNVGCRCYLPVHID